METLHQEKLQFSREQRVVNDVETLFAECLDGAMRTPFAYRYDSYNDKLYARDGSDMDTVFDDAIDHTRQVVAENPNMAFELRRQLKESDERHEMKAMMRGELPNTMIVVSDFPEELMNYGKDYGGYNAERKQTMLRVLLCEDNELKMYTQTLDGSDRESLEKIYEQFGVKPEAGELLGQRIHVDLDDVRRSTIVDELMHIYDSSLQQNNPGKRYHAGREVKSDEHLVNTYEFIKQQKDIVGLAVSEILNFKFDKEKQYATIALLHEKFEQYKRIGFNNTEILNQVNASVLSLGSIASQRAVLEQQRMMAGQQAQRLGKSFSGCGTTMSASLMTAEGEFSASGYTGFSEKSEDDTEQSWSYDKWTYCQECQAPPAEGEGKKMCGPCDICKDCVETKFGGKK